MMKRIYMIDENGGSWDGGDITRKGLDLYKIMIRKRGLEMELNQKLRVFIEENNRSKEITNLVDAEIKG